MPIWGAVIMGGASLGAGLFGASAAKDAASTQAESARQVAQMQQQAGQQASGLIGNAIPQAVNMLSPFTSPTSGAYSPYIQGGAGAFNSLASLYGIASPGNPGGQQGQNQAWGQMMQTPAYQFAQSQGQLGLDRTAAANGLLLSGGQLKDVMQFNQGLATQQIGNITNALSGIAGMGIQGAQGAQGASGMAGNMLLGGAEAQGGVLTGTSQMVGNTQMSGAQSTASGMVGAANSITGGVNSGMNNALLYYGMNRPGGFNPYANFQGYNPSSYGNGANQFANPSAYQNGNVPYSGTKNLFGQQ